MMDTSFQTQETQQTSILIPRHTIPKFHNTGDRKDHSRLFQRSEGDAIPSLRCTTGVGQSIPLKSQMDTSQLKSSLSSQLLTKWKAEQIFPVPEFGTEIATQSQKARSTTESRTLTSGSKTNAHFVISSCTMGAKSNHSTEAIETQTPHIVLTEIKISEQTE